MPDKKKKTTQHAEKSSLFYGLFYFFSLPFAVLVIEHKDGNIDSALKKNRMTADYFYSESTLNLKI